MPKIGLGVPDTPRIDFHLMLARQSYIQY